MKKPPPKCVVFIFDGNRRWAKERGLPALAGHKRGLEVGRTIVEAALKAGVPEVAVWGASESNLRLRKKPERKYLFRLLKDYLRENLESPEEVRFRIRGVWQDFTDDPELPILARQVEEKTAKFHERQLTLLFGYDGARDIEQATQSLYDEGCRPTIELIKERLWTAHLPDPVDIIIRTGIRGDPHDSDAFLPLQRRGAMLVFEEKFWPDFTVEDFHRILKEWEGFECRGGA